MILKLEWKVKDKNEFYLKHYYVVFSFQEAGLGLWTRKILI